MFFIINIFKCFYSLYLLHNLRQIFIIYCYLELDISFILKFYFIYMISMFSVDPPRCSVGSTGSSQILNRFQQDSQQLPARFSTGSRHIRSRFQPDYQQVPIRFCTGSSQILNRFQPDSQQVSARFSTGSSNILNSFQPDS